MPSAAKDYKMKKEDLKKFVGDNPKLVTMRPAGDGIYVLKYKRTVFYDNLWNEYLEECRGTIVDKDFNLIAYPFQKIYNLGVESRAPVIGDDTPVTAYRKVNGFMVAMTWYRNDVLVSTTGSTDSDFVGYAREMMQKHMPWADWQMALMNDDCRDMTFMFEACHKNDPHIIPEKEGLHILGYREKSWGSNVGRDPDMLDNLAEMFKCHKAEGFTTTVGELVKLSKTCKHEGFVAYTEDGQAFKIKSPYYLIQKALARKKDILSLNKELVEEEYFPLVDHLSSMSDQFNSLDEQTRLDYIRSFLSK
jgi:hypothetical protein